MQWIGTGNAAVAGYLRTHENDRFLVLHNLSDREETLTLPRELQGDVSDLLTDTARQLGASVTLEPFAYLWLKYDGR
jgi:hypothetical protein